MPIIEVKNLSKTYDYYKQRSGFINSLKGLFYREKLFNEAVKGIDFEIDEGELVGFLGPNGAGKTTTLKILSGILFPTGGKAKVLGYVPWERRTEYQKQFALVMGQKNQLWRDLPAMDSFILNKEIYELSDKEFNKELDRLVELLDIKDVLNVQVRKLSLGQRMKCELTAALLHKPRVLFLDEPTIGLDVVAQKNIRDFIKEYNQIHKTTVLLTSHYMEDVKELCERVIIIDCGQIMYDGSFERLISRYAPDKLLKITFEDGGVEKGEIEKYGTIDSLNQGSCIIKVPRKMAKHAAREILSSDLPVDDILIDEVEISEVVRQIFSKK